MVFVVVLLAELLAISVVLAEPGSVAEMLSSLALVSLLSLWIALGCVAALCLLQPIVRTLNDYQVATCSYVTILLVTLVIAELAWRVGVSNALVALPGGQGHAAFIVRSVGISAIAWALALRYFYVGHQWRRRLESEAQARFQALQARIRPHFLFNCMNTIAGLTRRSPQLAEKVVEDLSDLLRASLHEAREPVTLAEELALCESYLRVEKHRLGDRLILDWQPPRMHLDTRLPALILQPLMENAVYHGVEPLPGGGTISLGHELLADAVRITITNPYAAGTAARGHHMAQSNVAQRLASFFDSNDLLRIEARGDLYRVDLTLPFRHENPP